MAVGNQPSVASMNNQLTNYAIQLRNNMQAIRNLFNEVTNGGSGQANLEAIGFTASDATSFLAFLSNMNTVGGVYYGTVQQGGSGGTGASVFDFDEALAPLWAAQ